MPETLGMTIKLIGYGIFLGTGLWAFYLDIQILWAITGPLVGIAAIVLGPVTHVIAPLYAGLAWGYWFPTLLAYGGGFLGFAMISAGSALAGD